MSFWQVPLTQGKYAIIDEDMVEEIEKHSWYYVGGRPGSIGYAKRSITLLGGVRFILCMQNVIFPPLPGMVIDHINRNGLDNRRENLRQATKAQNNLNRLRKDGRKFRGVSQNTSGKWVAHIKYQNKDYLRTMETEIEAAKAYNEMAESFFGEFAVLNQIPKGLLK